jgi:two-component system, NarL family, sensor histidine kinase UhpB
MRLTTYLLSRLVVSGIVILFIAIFWLMYSNHARANQEIVSASTAMMRILEVQAVGFRQGIGLEPRFPDWYPATQVSLPSGACIRLLDASQRTLNSTCHGKVRATPEVPAWFQWLYEYQFGSGEPLTRELTAHGKTYYVEVIPDGDVEVALVWERTQLAIILTTIVVSLLGAVTAWSIHHAISPVASIVAALSELQGGAFDTRLGVYRFTELNQIALACDSLAGSLREEQLKRNALFQRIQTIQEQERRMIALELHDEFGQYLSAINANATAPCSAKDVHTAKADAKRIQTNVHRLVILVDELLQKLRPHPSSGANIEEMVRGLLKESAEVRIENFDITLSSNGSFDHIPNEVATTAYRIVQESLTNAKRHASAEHVEVLLHSDENVLKISITDDGSASAQQPIKKGFGIVGMQERAAALGGKTEINFNQGKGLTVHAVLPYSKGTESP